MKKKIEIPDDYFLNQEFLVGELDEVIAESIIDRILPCSHQ